MRYILDRYKRYVFAHKLIKILNCAFMVNVASRDGILYEKVNFQFGLQLKLLNILNNLNAYICIERMSETNRIAETKRML